MMKWSPWSVASAKKKVHVKVKTLKLEGLNGRAIEKYLESKRVKVLVIEIKWKGPNKPVGSLVSFDQSAKRPKNVSSERCLRKGVSSIQWDNEFEKICELPTVPKDGTLSPRDVSFNVLYGESVQIKTKLAVMGKVSLNIAELALSMDAQIERKLPITLHVAGVAIEANLLVSVSLIEIRNSYDSLELIQNSTGSNKDEKFLRWVTGYLSPVDKKKRLKNKEKKSPVDELSSSDSNKLATFDSKVLPLTGPITMARNSYVDSSSGTELGSSPSSETQLDPVRKVRFWKRQRLGSRPARVKAEPLIKKTSIDDDSKDVDVDCQLSSSYSVDSVHSIQRVKSNPSKPSKTCSQDEHCSTRGWEVKELVSRDGQAKLKACVFFASFDQRSMKAAGENACTVLAAVIAHWLQLNQDIMPTRSQFDSLIREGSFEWRKLCKNEAYSNCFPDKHFDLETVLQADLRPLTIMRERSFVGFFSPEKFKSLKGLMSFDEMWNEINNTTKDYEPKVYIVGWNDHFFVLKVEVDAYYIIDTLGERLFEGCNKAYILKFDKSASIYGTRGKEKVGSVKMARADTAILREESEEIICTGKECCREFIKRFLAAIPLRELEMEEKKGTVASFSLHQRLQIEFHYSSSSSSSSSANSSSSSSFSSQEYIQLEKLNCTRSVIFF